MLSGYIVLARKRAWWCTTQRQFLARRRACSSAKPAKDNIQVELNPTSEADIPPTDWTEVQSNPGSPTEVASPTSIVQPSQKQQLHLALTEHLTASHVGDISHLNTNTASRDITYEGNRHRFSAVGKADGDFAPNRASRCIAGGAASSEPEPAVECEKRDDRRRSRRRRRRRHSGRTSTESAEERSEQSGQQPTARAAAAELTSREKSESGSPSSRENWRRYAQNRRDTAP